MSNQQDHILIVDDDRDIRGLLADYLEKQGLRCTTAADGREMKAALDRHRIDLIVLDLMMPGEDGLTLCRNLRAAGGAPANTPILMLTARGEDMDRIVGLEMGADDYLAKPFVPRELFARIRAILRRARALPPNLEAAPPANAPCVENTPAAAPAARRPGTAPFAGPNAAIASRHTGRPPRWQLRCTAGFHPPATARQSAPMRCSRPPCATRTSRRPIRPRVPVTMPPAKLRHGPSGSLAPSRTSISAATSTPAAAKSAAVRQPSSPVANTTARRGATTQRLR